MEDQPLVSILMTAYNREKYIAEAIESVIASTYQHLELIIVDDGSKDNTVEIAKSYEAKDSRIKVYINEINLGDYPNRNRAASYAKGKYLKYVDSDDMIYPTSLALMVEVMEKYPEAGMATSSRYVEPKVGNYYYFTPKQAYQTHFFEHGFLDNGPTAVIIRKSIFDELGGFGIRRNISDYELWLRIAQTKNVIELPTSLVFWRQHEGQEIAVASDCYIENLYPMVVKILKSEGCPLQPEHIEMIVKKMRKATFKSIVKDLLKTKDLPRMKNLLAKNGFTGREIFRAVLD